MNKMLVVAVGLLGTTGWAGESALLAGIETVKKGLQEELDWVESLVVEDVAQFLKETRPVGLEILGSLRRRSEEATPDDRGDVRHEMREATEGLLDNFREYQRLCKDNPATAGTYLERMHAQDRLAAAEIRLEQMEQGDADKKTLRRQRGLIEILANQVEDLGELLDEEDDDDDDD